MTATDLGLPWGDAFDPGPPTEEQMAEQEAILSEQLDAGGAEPPPDELLGFLPDPDTGPPEGEDACSASPAATVAADAGPPGSVPPA